VSPTSPAEEDVVTSSIAPREARIRRALDHLRNQTTDDYGSIGSFEATDFTDPGIAARERDLVFGRVPSIVAHTSELPEPHDFLTLRMPRNQIIVVRQKDGGVKAFVNLCRHRGALLEEREKGRCRLFSCGYHRWSYDTDGTLRTVTRGSTFGEIDRADHGLVELPTQERHGFIWLVDDADADIDVADWLGPDMDGVLAQYGLADLVAFQAEGFEEPVNWKIMQDAFLDGYHIQYAHPNTAAKHVHTNVQAFEDFGRHCRFIAPRKTIDRWIDEDPGDRSLAKHVIETHFLMPNSTLLRQPDHFQLLTFRPHPKDPGRSRMEMRLIVPKVEDSGMDEESWSRLWAKNWKILLAVLHQEDFPLLRGSQSGMESASAGPMLLGRNEIANHVFHRELRRLTQESP
jgi:phenylpropionate dioxygenase-like ring-hydroxylating dioxygenase large terminal subunit